MIGVMRGLKVLTGKWGKRLTRRVGPLGASFHR
jgi:hypothetical protein